MDLPFAFGFRGWSVRYNLLGAVEKSNAKPVVFVHGTPWSSAVFKPVIDALLPPNRKDASYKVLVYDLPGYGQSQVYHARSSSTSNDRSTTKFEGDTSVKFQAETLSALLKLTGLAGEAPPPAIVAHDIAGAIVLRTHLLHDRLDFASMLLLDTNAVLPWGDGFYKLVRAEPETFLKLPPSIFEAMVRAVIRSACADPRVLEAGWEDELARSWVSSSSSAGDDGGRQGDVDRQRSFVRQIAQADDANVAEMLDADLYAQVRCDVKIIWGEADQWIPKAKIEELVQKLKGRVKECAFVPNAGHLVMLDQPARVAVEVFDWLNRS